MTFQEQYPGFVPGAVVRNIASSWEGVIEAVTPRGQILVYQTREQAYADGFSKKSFDAIAKLNAEGSASDRVMAFEYWPADFILV